MVETFNGTYDQLFNSSNILRDNLVIDFAVLYNVHKQGDSQIELNAIDLNYNEFLNLFYYSNGGGFAINPNAKYFNVLQLNNLYYTSNNNKMKWNLKNQLIKTFSKKNNVPESSLSPITRIKLDREAFLLNSLSLHNKSQIALSLDEVFHSLEDTNNVSYTGDSDDSIMVNVRLHYLYYSDCLDTTISFILPFRVKFPKFKLNSSKEERNIKFEYSKHELVVPGQKECTAHKFRVEKEVSTDQRMEFYEDDDTIQTAFGTKNLMSSLFDDNEGDCENILLDDDTHFRTQPKW